ncbi:metal-dependent hydrolase [Haloplanus halobius]|uniref:metal-dependent hydrolase n=1 Tax=Haloplanus halobius TaxID=2934938 RepID=UPI00200CA6F1|nr:metal-dependent hydrolase [Haloplanus sp. XH21]
MLPLGHAAVAYLSYVSVAAATRRHPSRLSLVPLLVASQLPDLVDKPLVFLRVLPSGRSLGHSVFVLCLWLLLLVLVRRRVATDPASTSFLHRLVAYSPVAFAVGYASHLLADSYVALLDGRWHAASYLLYPLLPAPVYPADDISPLVRLARIYATPWHHDQFWLVVLAGGTVALHWLWLYRE